jgi:hypothetical protein
MRRPRFDLAELFVRFLTPSGRERARRLRAQETAAILIGQRLALTEQLASIGTKCLSTANYNLRALAHERPDLDEPGRVIVESLAKALDREIVRFTGPGEGRRQWMSSSR